MKDDHEPSKGMGTESESCGLFQSTILVFAQRLRLQTMSKQPVTKDIKTQYPLNT
jgi:hypothetical protein